MKTIKHRRLQAALRDLHEDASEGGLLDLADTVARLLRDRADADDAHDALASYGYAGARAVLRSHCGLDGPGTV